MAPAGKFSHPASMVVVSGVLILLSVSAAGERQCSWCGPLADQVHRSQRAPSCDEPGETTCENGLSHCAIIASSPPYLESRLCVKYYQDECYSIFCNSSRTWRMTCPCRGDFCNKEKTAREHEAFTFLATLGSKIRNLRIKKRTVTPENIRSPTLNRTAIVNEENGANDTDQSEIENVLTDQESTINDNMTEANMKDSNMNVLIDKSNNDSNDLNINVLHNSNTTGNENNVVNNVTSPTDMNEANGIIAMDKGNVNTNNLTNTSRYENIVKATTNSPNLNEMVNDMPATTETPVSITQAKASEASVLDVKPNEMPRNDEPRKDINIDVSNNIAEVSPTEAYKTADEKVSKKIDIKPSVALPAAEALQQNSSPSAVTEKNLPTTEQATTDTTNNVVRTNVQVQVTTTTSEPMKMKKNNAVAISLHFLPILFWVIFKL